MSQDKTKAALDQVISLFSQLELLVSYEKSFLASSIMIEFIGALLDTVIVRIPARRQLQVSSVTCSDTRRRLSVMVHTSLGFLRHISACTYIMDLYNAICQTSLGEAYTQAQHHMNRLVLGLPQVQQELT